MIVPAKTSRDTFIEILCCVCCLEYPTMNGVLDIQWMFDLMIWGTWHLLGINSMSHARSHYCKVSRSAWKVSLSSEDPTVR